MKKAFNFWPVLYFLFFISLQPCSGETTSGASTGKTDLTGYWMSDESNIGGRIFSVSQQGDAISFRNENGQSFKGKIVNSSTVIAIDWNNLHGDIVDRGKRIIWKNNSQWVKGEVTVSPKPSTGKAPIPMIPMIPMIPKIGNTETSQMNSGKPSATVGVKNFQTEYQELLRLTNEVRTKAGLRPLRLESKLTAAAERHSKDMAKNDFLDHKGSDNTRGEQRISQAGYNWTRWGENVSMGQGPFGQPSSVVQRWMESPTHRKNILTPEFAEIGFGIVEAADGTRFITQVFGTP